MEILVIILAFKIIRVYAKPNDFCGDTLHTPLIFTHNTHIHSHTNTRTVTLIHTHTHIRTHKHAHTNTHNKHVHHSL